MRRHSKIFYQVGLYKFIFAVINLLNISQIQLLLPTNFERTAKGCVNWSALELIDICFDNTCLLIRFSQ